MNNICFTFQSNTNAVDIIYIKNIGLGLHAFCGFFNLFFSIVRIGSDF